MSVYLTAPANTAAAALAFAIATLLGLGYNVAIATPAGFDVDDLLSAVTIDQAAVEAADVVVTLPGSGNLWEPVYAAAYGVPVAELADVLAGGDL